jgi:phage/plasmid-associated DNA primase
MLCKEDDKLPPSEFNPLGNDIYYPRMLYKEPIHIEPMFKLAMVASDLPGKYDDAIWKRMKTVIFKDKRISFWKKKKKKLNKFRKLINIIKR